jgi:hypothetical protein
MQPQQEHHCVVQTLRSGRLEFRLSRQAGTQLAQALESLLKNSPCNPKAGAVRNLIQRLKSFELQPQGTVQLAAGDMAVIAGVRSSLRDLGTAATAALKIADSSLKHTTNGASADVRFRTLGLNNTTGPSAVNRRR